jgi:hypothetical protein
MEALCAVQKDKYRKGTGTGMWELLTSTDAHGLSNGATPPCTEESFFVGDAAGTPSSDLLNHHHAG